LADWCSFAHPRLPPQAVDAVQYGLLPFVGPEGLPALTPARLLLLGEPALAELLNDDTLLQLRENALDLNHRPAHRVFEHGRGNVLSCVGRYEGQALRGQLGEQGGLD